MPGSEGNHGHMLLTYGVDKGAEWHEQLNSILTNLTLKQLLTRPSSSMLNNTAVTVKHLALLCTGLYSLSKTMLSTCPLSDVLK